MRHEKIFKRKDGSRIKVEVELWVDIREHHYRITLYKCQPRKRTFVNVVDTDNYKFRSLSHDDKLKQSRQESLKHATPEEIRSACLELWEKIKP